MHDLMLNVLLYIGTVFRASECTGTRQEFVIKLSNARPNNRSLDHEHSVLSQLRGIAGIPQPVWFGLESGRNILVLNYLGLSLEDAFNICGQTFSLGTVCLIADRLVRSLFLRNHELTTTRIYHRLYSASADYPSGGHPFAKLHSL